MTGANSSPGSISPGKMRSSTDLLWPLLIMSWGIFFAPTGSRDGVCKGAAALNREPRAAIGRSGRGCRNRSQRKKHE
jgi:hypothetical protein